MFANLEALLAVEHYGTISRAAVWLGLTQSAVSKRIQTLEQVLGRKLIEPTGRTVSITPFGVRLIERSKPLFLELKEALAEEVSEQSGELIIAISGALMLSWGESVLKRVRQDNPGIILTFNSHRSPIATARVRSGDCMIAVVHGESELTPDLMAKHICDDTFVVVPADLKPFTFPRSGKLELLTIESHSETWSALERKLRLGSVKWGVEFYVRNTMENFMSVAQLARSGFCHGIVPLSVALALGIPRNKLVPFPGQGLSIPVSIVGRGTTLDRSIVKFFYESLQKHAVSASARALSATIGLSKRSPQK